jgi:hypothetical protein
MTFTHSRAAHVLLLLGTALLLSACKLPSLRPSLPSMPSFLKREAPAVVAEAPAPVPTVDPSLTPRELLIARLINARAAGDAMPGMTVGKLIEYADRYLTCDCADTRFARAWERTSGGYLLSTHSAQVQPLDFRCTGNGADMSCFLREIDRGANLPDLKQRFMPGSDFIRFIYEKGSKCERTEPCPNTNATH